MKKKYLSPDIQVETFIAESSYICTDPSGMPQGTGDDELGFGGL